LRRYFKHRWTDENPLTGQDKEFVKVKYVQNFTDVDDKIINKANEEGISSKKLSDKYIKEYFIDARGLNVLDADVHPRVSENMDAIISLVEKIMKNGYAYQVDNDVFFSVRKFKDYGKFSGKNIDDLLSGARIDANEKKQDPLDFALWKGAKPGEPSWDSPWGKGRPGWHIECSAMSMKYLGETIDIHCGGADLIFPHHENEVAQSEAATGKPFARFWLHNGFIEIDNKKMSKSEGNFFLVRNVAEKYGYEVIRYMMISAHYASPINYTEEIIKSLKTSLDRLYQCRENLSKAIAVAPNGEIGAEVEKKSREYNLAFMSSMDNDLNTSSAFAVLFDLVRYANTLTMDERVTKQALQKIQSIFETFVNIFGLLYERKEETIPQEVSDLKADWENARKDKNFELADSLKAQISNLGYKVEVTRQGTNIKKI
jgi:cysteinyl-tRNA synthetase